jgi:NDP-sugar pyrophosphorylase family protein
VSMGIYCINRSVVEAIPRGQPYGFDRLMTDSLAVKRSVAIYPFDGFWLDIGRPDDYESANRDFEAIFVKLGIPK